MRNRFRPAQVLTCLALLVAAPARSGTDPQVVLSRKESALVQGRPAGGDAPARTLGDALDRALSMLVKEKADAEALSRRVGDERRKLAENKRTAADLDEKIAARNAMIKALQGDLGRWKDQVLGAREEVLRAEDVEKEVLQEIVVLLRTLNRRQQGQVEQPATDPAGPADAPDAGKPAAAPGGDHEK